MNSTHLETSSKYDAHGGNTMQGNIGFSFYGHTRHAPMYPVCTCCKNEVNPHIDTLTVWGKAILCNDCSRTRVPEPGERITVVKEDSEWFGYSFIVDALMNGEVLLAINDTFKLFKLSDIIRANNGKSKRR